MKEKTNQSEMKSNNLDRLERVIAHKGLSSRREAKALIRQGLVKVNGKVIKEPGFGIVADKDKISIDNSKVAKKESFLVYKRRGVETNRTTPNARDLHTEFPELSHLNPIGRLDKDSEGLMIMSNDGTLTKALTKENSNIGKEYLVTVREEVKTASLERMKNGILLDGVVTKPAIVKSISDNSFSITLFEGRKHQIRRMCDSCRLTIEELVRIKIGHLKVGNLKNLRKKKMDDKDVSLLKK